jgi:hypothetical protein
MIPYEELCAALERYRGDTGAAEPHADAATGQTALPSIQHQAAGGEEEEHTSIGVEPIYDAGSNELDIADVLSDEEAPKH